MIDDIVALIARDEPQLGFFEELHNQLVVVAELHQPPAAAELDQPLATAELDQLPATTNVTLEPLHSTRVDDTVVELPPLPTTPIEKKKKCLSRGAKRKANALFTSDEDEVEVEATPKKKRQRVEDQTPPTGSRNPKKGVLATHHTHQNGTHRHKHELARMQ